LCASLGDEVLSMHVLSASVDGLPSKMMSTQISIGVGRWPVSVAPSHKLTHRHAHRRVPPFPARCHVDSLARRTTRDEARLHGRGGHRRISEGTGAPRSYLLLPCPHTHTDHTPHFLSPAAHTHTHISACSRLATTRHRCGHHMPNMRDCDPMRSTHTPQSTPPMMWSPLAKAVASANDHARSCILSALPLTPLCYVWHQHVHGGVPPTVEFLTMIQRECTQAAQ